MLLQEWHASLLSMYLTETEGAQVSAKLRPGTLTSFGSHTEASLAGPPVANMSQAGGALLPLQTRPK